MDMSLVDSTNFCWLSTQVSMIHFSCAFCPRTTNHPTKGLCANKGILAGSGLRSQRGCGTINRLDSMLTVCFTFLGLRCLTSATACNKAERSMGFCCNCAMRIRQAGSDCIMLMVLNESVNSCCWSKYADASWFAIQHLAVQPIASRFGPHLWPRSSSQAKSCARH